MRSEEVLLEKVDVQEMKVGEKLVLLKWGVFEIIEKENDSLKIKFLPEDKDFKNPPKFTWLSNQPDNLIEVNYTEYGDLLKVKKVEENDDFDDIVNKDSKKEGKFIADALVRNLVKGDIIQFERKSFFILDSKEND